ncbi:MAG: hypothetical protein AMJ95_01250 [Omnitrophica WOR_2 bacterium SM23_72]|nr:MAG: hypothetical protein AMJ95_01250 [Omnitrophica WOR_2 bacterium SM23_72]
MSENRVKGFYFIFIILVLWQVAADLKIINILILPSPINVARSFFSMLISGPLLKDILSSIKRVLVGFLFACLVGVPAGIILGWNKRLSPYFLTTIEFIRPIPPIAWIPLAILWFGISDASSYFITTIACFFPIFTNAFFGARSVEVVHVNAAMSLGADRRLIIKDVVIPSVLPFIVTGMRVGLGVGWMSVIAAELIAAQSGLGYMIQLHRLLLETQKVIAGMAAIGLIGYIMNLSIVYLQHKLIQWKKI